MEFINIVCICMLTTIAVFNSLMLLDPTTSKGSCVEGIIDWALKGLKCLELLNGVFV